MENKVIAKEYVDKNYVEKDKIRKIIKNIEKEMEKDEVDDFGIHSLQWLAMDWIVDYLKRELLEDKQMIRNDIIEAYYEYRQNIINRYENPKYLQVVIIITPKGMSELLDEERYIECNPKDDCHYTSMFGRKTPIIIRTDLPENVEFVIQSQKDYERQEQERLLDKFFRMFGD